MDERVNEAPSQGYTLGTEQLPPLVSIVIATYNRSNYLGDALESCFAIGYPNIEIIVVDDGSTDDTRKLCASYDQTRLRYIFKEHSGCSPARNLGVVAACGRYIKFLDSDDLLLPDTLGDEVQLLQRSGADFCVSDSYEFYFRPKWRVLSRSVASKDPTMKNFSVDLFETSRNRNCAVLYERRIFESLSFREDLYFNEDSEFLQRVAINFRGSYYPGPTCIVRNHNANKSSDPENRVEVLDAQMRSLQGIYDSYDAFADQIGERRFILKMQDLARKTADAFMERGYPERSQQVLKAWNVDNYVRSGPGIRRKLIRRFVNGTPIGWAAFCLLRREVR